MADIETKQQSWFSLLVSTTFAVIVLALAVVGIVIAAGVVSGVLLDFLALGFETGQELLN